MSSSKAVPVIPGITERSTATQLISVLRNSSNREECDEIAKWLITRDARLREERNCWRRKAETLGKKQTETDAKLLKVENDLKKSEKVFGMVEEDLKEVETQKKNEKEEMVAEINQKNEQIEELRLGEHQAIRKLTEAEKLVELLYGVLRSEGITIHELEKGTAKRSHADVVGLMEDICFEDIKEEVEEICLMRSAAMRSSAERVLIDGEMKSVRECERGSSLDEDVHCGIDNSQLESENANFGVDKQGRSDKNLEQMKSFSIGRDEGVVWAGSSPMDFPVEGFTSLDANVTRGEIGVQELNVEARAALVPASNKSSSAIISNIRDTEEGNIAAQKRKNVDSDVMQNFKEAGPNDAAVHDVDDDDDDSSGSDMDVTCFVSYLEDKVKKFKRYKEIGWKSAADMLSAFENDFESCMTAVCALYRKRLTSEKSNISLWFLEDSDATSLKTLAEYLINGHHKNKLSKTVEEIQQEAPNVLSLCKDLAIRNCDILFDIYQIGGDPLFRPDL